MAIDEASRHKLRQRLDQVLGDEEANILMEHLPPVGWADVATKHDLQALEVATKHDLQALEVATKHDLQALEAATKRDLQALEAATKRDLQALENKLLAAFREETQKIMFSMMAFFVALSGVFLAAGKFF